MIDSYPSHAYFLSSLFPLRPLRLCGYYLIYEPILTMSSERYSQ